MQNINWHSVKMYAMIVLTFIIGGLSAMKGSTTGDFATVMSVLLFLQHTFGGNSSLSMKNPNQAQ